MDSRWSIKDGDDKSLLLNPVANCCNSRFDSGEKGVRPSWPQAPNERDTTFQADDVDDNMAVVVPDYGYKYYHQPPAKTSFNPFEPRELSITPARGRLLRSQKVFAHMPMVDCIHSDIWYSFYIRFSTWPQ
jgi:hypothetical protein